MLSGFLVFVLSPGSLSENFHVFSEPQYCCKEPHCYCVGNVQCSLAQSDQSGRVGVSALNVVPVGDSTWWSPVGSGGIRMSK